MTEVRRDGVVRLDHTHTFRSYTIVSMYFISPNSILLTARARTVLRRRHALFITRFCHGAGCGLATSRALVENVRLVNCLVIVPLWTGSQHLEGQGASYKQT